MTRTNQTNQTGGTRRRRPAGENYRMTAEQKRTAKEIITKYDANRGNPEALMDTSYQQSTLFELLSCFRKPMAMRYVVRPYRPMAQGQPQAEPVNENLRETAARLQEDIGRIHIMYMAMPPRPQPNTALAEAWQTLEDYKQSMLAVFDNLMQIAKEIRDGGVITNEEMTHYVDVMNAYQLAINAYNEGFKFYNIAKEQKSAYEPVGPNRPPIRLPGTGVPADPAHNPVGVQIRHGHGHDE